MVIVKDDSRDLSIFLCYKEVMKKQTVDLHRLDLRYSHIRVQNEKRIRRIADSISRHGQLEALVTVPGNNNSFVLIDGYQRQAALRYLGQDTAHIIIGDFTEEESLLQLLIQRGERQWEAIEEAGLIQELHHRFKYSFGEIGKQIGRKYSG